MSVNLSTVKKLHKIREFPSLEENTRDNFRLFSGFNRKKREKLEIFSDEVDPVHALFRFYGIILLLTLFAAAIVFVTLIFFGNIMTSAGFGLGIVSPLIYRNSLAVQEKKLQDRKNYGFN